MRRSRPWLIGLVAGCLLLQTGCAGGARTLTREDLLRPEAADSYLVRTVEGAEYTFISLHLEGEELVGTARTTTEEVVGSGPEARTVTSNRYDEVRLPWSEVAEVTADRGGRLPGGGFLLAAASVAAGVGLFLLISQGGDDEGTGGGGGGKDGF